MKHNAARLAVHALEQLGITHTFGIPGVHNTELYDALASSEKITPVLVTHEGGGAFMADAMSRVGWRPAPDSPGTAAIGCLAVVPAAGLTHAASGIGEAFLGGVPMLVITGGVRTDTPWGHKLHGVDQLELAKGITKAAFRVQSHAEVVPTIFKAYEIATSGQPGPVLVELPVNLQLFAGEVDALPVWTPPAPPPVPGAESIAQAASVLLAAKQPGLFVGWGARHAQAELIELAQHLQAPVATTLQGLSSFPGDHPLHAGFGFSPSAVPAAQNAFSGCDGLLAVGVRFGEIPTGSYGARVPEALVQVDIDPEAIGLDYPVSVGLVGDSRAVLQALLAEIKQRRPAPLAAGARQQQIAQDKAAYRQQWLTHDSQERVNPLHFFDALREVMPGDAVTVLDDGNHTFLAAELLTLHRGARLITPTDFNAMGYAVPAAIGAKLAQPERAVFAIVGDGCLAMTGLEMLTAAARGLGVVFCVFKDGELSQIAQAQQKPYRRKTCSVLHPMDLAALAQAVGAAYVPLARSQDARQALARASELAAQGQPVIVDVAIDYSRASAFTIGTSKTMFSSFATGDKLRFAGRMVWRKVTGGG